MLSIMDAHFGKWPLMCLSLPSLPSLVRDKYPELIPFRLTRMLVKAMEVCGIEGNFRR